MLAALFVTMSAASFALDTELGKTSSFKIVPKSDQKYDLYYVSESNEAVYVSIYDAQGELVSQDRIKDYMSFKRTYNFRNLASGNYTVVVRNEEGKGSQKVFHHPESTNMKMILSQIPDSKKFKLHMGQFDTSTPVKVKVYNSNNQLIFVDQVNSAEGFSKVYDLQKFKDSEVRFTIVNGTESITKRQSLL